MVDELEANFGGLITLVGAGASTLSGDWTLLEELDAEDGLFPELPSE
jgi:hypothetical protein